MKRRILGALFAVVGLSAMAGPAQAQAMLPAFEIATIVRSAGFAPLSPAFRRGETYVMRATRPDGREVRLVVDARRGRILSAVPVVAAARGGARAYGPIDGDEPDGPDGYIPPPPRGVYGSGPPVVYEGSRPVIYDRRPLEAIPNAPRADSPPPILREEGGEPGMLPPPPERFPSRAAPPAAPKSTGKPAAKPAPVKRAAAAPPLPKPKPAAPADEPAANAAPEPQAAPPESKPDARELPH
ncbi:MAG TPA: hypothetical protein VFV80_08190 [Geminicoccaceae bacterium]|nr:hypothetical protein [Geminicoccaceae bacterium]